MNRRDLFKTSLAASALALTGNRTEASAAAAVPAEFPKAPGLTKSVAEFIVNTKYEDIPADVVELGRKSILDGFGLALAGSASVMGPIARKYAESFGTSEMRASVIGTSMKAHPRLAAFVNGVSIHADDYDDTQLSAAKDRIYGLLTHPTVSVLPPAFALCELGTPLRQGFHGGLSHGRGSRDQDQRSHCAASLRRRLSFHRHLRHVWQHRGLLARCAAWT